MVDSIGRAPLVLVVDDSRAQRQLSSMYLRRWGYEVMQAASAAEALEICARAPVDMVISDWMMPGMNGVEFCRRFRALPRETYGYFILVTSKSDKSEVARGLEAGADDFLTKPFSSDELRARLRAGQRIQDMQAELVGKKRVVQETLGELQRLYDALDRDLIEARKLQSTLLRDRHRNFGASRVAMMVRTAGRIGGDLVGCFRLDARRIAVWSVDVSGHGVASAMMTVRLGGYLSEGAPDQNIAFTTGLVGQRHIRGPAELAAAFNRLMLDELQVEQYFTLAYAELDETNGALRLVQAGHPHPLILRAGGGVERVGQGGLPVGLIEDARYEEISLHLAPGDRLVLISDGVSECPDPSGTELGEEAAAELIRRASNPDPGILLENLVALLAEFAGVDQFPDDVSGLVLDYTGPGSAR
ncbi:PP2C family protein-serine/threonine phosphatase [Pseudogemmobacter bohemicus]|uniref:PP2C family protein-serine/threonine phosphatase n=1 Tax=Pseudogemmobacter bohemicus TaxID=2250708 RepID=UPI000DD3D67D|nr:SpoIIE family protein phosphatase [Pseudogemmobacter bohemicus]